MCLCDKLCSGESAVSPDGRCLAVTTLQSTVRVYEITATGLALLHDFPSPTDVAGNFPLQVSFAEFQKLLISGSDNGELRLWALGNGQKTALIHDDCERHTGLSHTHKGK